MLSGARQPGRDGRTGGIPHWTRRGEGGQWCPALGAEGQHRHRAESATLSPSAGSSSAQDPQTLRLTPRQQFRGPHLRSGRRRRRRPGSRSDPCCIPVWGVAGPCCRRAASRVSTAEASMTVLARPPAARAFASPAPRANSGPRPASPLPLSANGECAAHRQATARNPLYLDLWSWQGGPNLCIQEGVGVV